MKRIFRHLLTPPWWARRCFPPALQREIGTAVAACETRHRGELRFVVEGAMPLADLGAGHSARQRAQALFASLHVWDTEENSGILIYVQLVDRRVEVVADRGIAARVAQAEWDAICRAMEAAFKAGDWRGGALAAIAAAGDLLALHFPATGDNPDELPDAPLIL